MKKKKLSKRIKYLFAGAFILSCLAISVQFYLLKLQYIQVGNQTRTMVDELLKETINQYQLSKFEPSSVFRQAVVFSITDTIHEREISSDRTDSIRFIIKSQSDNNEDFLRDQVNIDSLRDARLNMTHQKKDSGAQQLELFFNDATIQNNVTQLLNSYMKLFNRSSKDIAQIDSLFKQMMKNKAIDLDYTLQVIEIPSWQVLMETDSTLSKRHENLWSTSLHMISYNNSLQVLYKNPNIFVLKQMAGLILISALVLILILCFLFYYLNIILQQKKIETVREDFVHSMTHELRNPLQSAVVLLEVLGKESVRNNPAMRDDVMARLQSNLHDMKSQIDTLLTLSLSDKLNTTLEKDKHDLKDLLENLINMYTITSDKPVHFTLHVETTQNVAFYNSIHLTNALKNLIENAIKYSGDEVNIDITLKETEHKFIIEIKDNGIGIAKENFALIFKQYHRIPPSEKGRNINGFGLGLSYVKWVVENHGGQIRVESEEHKGSDFIIEIPK